MLARRIWLRCVLLPSITSTSRGHAPCRYRTLQSANQNIVLAIIRARMRISRLGRALFFSCRDWLPTPRPRRCHTRAILRRVCIRLNKPRCQFRYKPVCEWRWIRPGPANIIRRPRGTICLKVKRSLRVGQLIRPLETSAMFIYTAR